MKKSEERKFENLRALIGLIMGEPRTHGDSPNNLKSFPGPPPDFGRPSPINCWFRCVLLSHQLQSCTKRSHVEGQLECDEYSAALSSLSPPVCPPPPSPTPTTTTTTITTTTSPLPTNAHVFDVRTWHRSHQAAKFSLPHVCVTPKHDVRLSLFLSPAPDVQEHKRSTPRCCHQGQYHNILRSDHPMDTSQTSHGI